MIVKNLKQQSESAFVPVSVVVTIETLLEHKELLADFNEGNTTIITNELLDLVTDAVYLENENYIDAN